MKKRYALALLCCLTAAGCQTGSRAPVRPSEIGQVLAVLGNPESETVLVAAHRGAHRHAPENSLAAIQEAITKGVDIVEADVRQTRDGVLVLLHDATLDRTTTGTGKVAEMTFGELRQARLKGPLHETPQAVPTLAEALDAARGHLVLDLDIKDVDPNRLLDTVRGAKALNRVLFFTADTALLEALCAREPRIRIMPRIYAVKDLPEPSQSCRVAAIHIDRGFHNAETTEAIHRLGASVWVNALGNPDFFVPITGPRAAYGPLVAHGADIIQTDWPALLVRHLRKMGRHW